MEQIHWEMSVLSKSVAYKNLSGASAQVGLSQPQLSRIIAKLEQQLGIILLDRSTKRKATWTPIAYKLVEIYGKAIRNLDLEFAKVVDNSQLKQIRIGALEGLVPVVMPFANKLIAEFQLKSLELGVYDLNELEALFFKDEFDLIFVSREPGRRKFKYSRQLGYQVMEEVSRGNERAKAVNVVSSFEHATERGGARSFGDTPVFISNSLAVRRQWLEQFGGTGIIPAPMAKQRPSGNQTVENVLLLGGDALTPKVWERVTSCL